MMMMMMMMICDVMMMMMIYMYVMMMIYGINVMCVDEWIVSHHSSCFSREFHHECVNSLFIVLG